MITDFDFESAVSINSIAVNKNSAVQVTIFFWKNANVCKTFPYEPYIRTS